MFSRGGTGGAGVCGTTGVGGDCEALWVWGGGVGCVGVERGRTEDVAGRGVAVPGFSPGGGFGYTGCSGDSGGILVGAGDDSQGEIVEVCGVVVDGGKVLVDMVCGEEEDVLF